MDLLIWEELDIIPMFRHPKRRKGSYFQKDQVEFYSVNRDEDSEDSEHDLDMTGPSEHFCKRYRFQPKTVEALCLLLGGRLHPKAKTNNAFSAMQKLCIALHFYATGMHQIEVGDGEGASQASVS